MEHILDNPIWNALITKNSKLSNGDERARYFNRDVGAFAGLKDNSVDNLNNLYTMTPPGVSVVLFTPAEINIPENWIITLNRKLCQMIYDKLSTQQPKADGQLTDLTKKDVPAMLELVSKTQPGPFLIRTIDLGNYQGIFSGDRLVAMAGQRLQPTPFTEISAVCTDPEYSGKGYAARLIRSQLDKILSGSRTPFLHVYPENTAACNLYQKIGFRVRKEMRVYVIQRPAT